MDRHLLIQEIHRMWVCLFIDFLKDFELVRRLVYSYVVLVVIGTRVFKNGITNSGFKRLSIRPKMFLIECSENFFCF